jgi:hypothetical protein
MKNRRSKEKSEEIPMKEKKIKDQENIFITGVHFNLSSK